MSQEQWSAVDEYLSRFVALPDTALEQALRHSEASGLPAIQVAPNQGKLLALLARSIGARRILEVGTLGGYSTIWLARSVPEGGEVVTLELEPHHAQVAQENLERAGVADKVQIRVGQAKHLLGDMVEGQEGPFDFIFVDADKASITEYFEASLQLARPGAMIVLDNVIRNGEILDQSTSDPHVQGVQRLYARLAGEPRIMVTALQTVGCKGYDGLAVALVLE